MSNTPPLRVAVIGSGPAGFYTADFLLKSKTVPVEVDMFERFPVPYGLVRFGVAPDHQTIKRVSAAFERIAAHPTFRFFGNVEVGRELPVSFFRDSYHALVFATGSATDKRLGIPGEDLRGSAPATAFVGWYNGHPDFQEHQFELGAERAVVVGMGNVAMDVARILVRDPSDLATSDITHVAHTALNTSRVREVVLLGRRGALQVAFDQGELADIAALPSVDVIVDGPLPEGEPEGLDSAQKKSLEYLRELAARPLKGAPRRVRLRFLVSPAEVIGDGAVHALRIERNALVASANGQVSARGTGEFETLETGLVLRSIGYHGVAIPGVPFDERAGTIPNQKGRITDRAGGTVVPGLYAVGWIKRGPSGLIGTNKSDAKDTVDGLLLDAPALIAERGELSAELVTRALADLGHRAVSFSDWRKLDALEVELGKSRGKVREKFLTVAAMLDALGL